MGHADEVAFVDAAVDCDRLTLFGDVEPGAEDEMVVVSDAETPCDVDVNRAEVSLDTHVSVPVSFERSKVQLLTSFTPCTPSGRDTGANVSEQRSVTRHPRLSKCPNHCQLKTATTSTDSGLTSQFFERFVPLSAFRIRVGLHEADPSCCGERHV